MAVYCLFLALYPIANKQTSDGWMDGGWVRPLETVNDEVRSWGADIPKWSQDIDMPKIATMARKAQPGILMVDRTVHGPYENYQTPEQRIPATQLDVVPESVKLFDNFKWLPFPDTSVAVLIPTLLKLIFPAFSL